MTIAAHEVSKATVLVVDDNEQLLEVLREVLEMNGFDVVAARRADEALELLRQERPDAIISDIMMPGVDGYKFNMAVRNDPLLCDIPFIFLTALADEKDIRQGRSNGCDDYLVKPFNPLDLAAVVEGKVTLAKQRKQAEAERYEKFRRRVVQTLSHEFRTPLVAINTGAELLAEQHERLSQDQVIKLISSIQRGGARLQRLVEDFMTLQQIDSGIAAISAREHRKSESLARVTETAIDCYNEIHGLEPGTIRLVALPSANPYPPYGTFYDIQVMSSLHRLFSNALKFGGTKVMVSVTSCAESTSVFVRDNGSGMTDVMAQKARELFAQIDRERNEQQGCGLGLTIASYFVAINDGELYFRRPEDGQGLEVELRFPRTLA